MPNRRQTLSSLAGLAMAAALPGAALAQSATIVDVAAGNPDFSTLVAAVEAAGLVETLQGPGPFTVFAPTDEAFAALPAGTVEALLEDPEALANILTYHVVPGQMDAEFLTGQRGRIEMVNGEFVHMDATGEGVRLNRTTNVVAADVSASNGIIHVIDRVLLPN
ncbi:MAG: fasciclin domain-containing protein [Alkalilacustris sp.]